MEFVKKNGRRIPRERVPARISSRFLRCHEQVEFLEQAVFFHHADECLAVLPDACTGATYVSCDFGVAVVFAFLAQFHADSEVFVQLGILLDCAADELNRVFPVAVAFEMVFVCDLLENFHHARYFWRAFDVGAALQGKVYADFTLAAFGILAFFVGQEPSAFLGGICDEGDAQIRVESRYGVVEQVVGVAHQVFLTFLGTAVVEAEVGIYLEGLSCHDSCDAVSANVPEFLDCLVADILIGGSLGDSNEVVDGGGGGVGVLHGRFLWLLSWRGLGGEILKKDDRTPFDS